VPFDPEVFAGDPWARGPWSWRLSGPRPFGAPLPWRGNRGLFEVPLTAALLRELGAVGLAPPA
jgi:hypothetical protein